MVGLLYKDFIAVNGKKIVWGVLFCTVLLLLFTVFVKSEDAIIVMGGALNSVMLFLPLFVSMYLENSLFAADAGKKKKAYLLSLPVTKKQYVASKYLFVLISYYVIMSVVCLWGLLLNSVTQTTAMNDLIANLVGLMPLYIYLCFILSALELPFFILLGVPAGNALKTGLLIVVFFAMLVYILFGDLTLLDHIDLATFLKYMEEHVEFTFALQTCIPIIAGLSYYLSYVISATGFARKESMDEE